MIGIRGSDRVYTTAVAVCFASAWPLTVLGPVAYWDPIQEYRNDAAYSSGGPGYLLQIIVVGALLAVVSFPVIYLLALARAAGVPGPPSVLVRAYRLTAERFWEFIGSMVFAICMTIPVLIIVPTVVVYGLFHSFQGIPVPDDKMGQLVFAEYAVAVLLLFIAKLVKTARSMWSGRNGSARDTHRCVLRGHDHK